MAAMEKADIAIALGTDKLLLFVAEHADIIVLDGSLQTLVDAMNIIRTTELNNSCCCIS